MRVAVLGATGRVGRLVMEAAAEAGDTAIPVGRDLVLGDADVVVDFSLPDALAAALPLLGDLPLVTGTTGLPDALQKRIEELTVTNAVVQAANFSTGVNVLLDLVGRAAGALPDADIEIVETHHRHKRDAPSGTAIALARAAAVARGVPLDAAHGWTGLREAGRIGIHAVRIGDVVGEHQVWLGSPGDRVLLGHVATSRRTFAEGALRAARWLVGRRPGRYTMRDVLGL